MYVGMYVIVPNGFNINPSDKYFEKDFMKIFTRNLPSRSRRRNIFSYFVLLQMSDLRIELSFLRLIGQHTIYNTKLTYVKYKVMTTIDRFDDLSSF